MLHVDLADLAIAPTQNLGAYVTAQLRRAIITQTVAPGTHLVESQLSIAFDVSRGPIRDALKQLETEGLVESRRRGMFVVGLTEGDIEELYTLRLLIEQHALTRAIEASDTDWSAADAALARMREASGSGDAQGFARADLAFHTAFYDIARRPRIRAVWQQCEPTFAVLLDLTNAEDRDLGPTLGDHVELLDAARAGDGRRAADLLVEHLAGSQGRLLASHRRLSAGRTSSVTTG